jgi:toxin ParE1/3/4
LIPTYEVVVSPDAMRDLSEIHDYISADNVRAANKMIARILGSFTTAATFPEIGRRVRVYARARRLVVGKYLVYYATDPVEERVTILRVLDGRRDDIPR